MSFTQINSHVTGKAPMAVKSADFNNDTFLDLVVANRDDATTSILLGYGNGSFKSYRNLPNGINASTNGIAIGDVNNDYRSDIVVVNRNTNNIVVFLGQGNGDFTECVTYSIGINSVPVALALGDFDSDTNLDLVVTDHHNNILLILIGTGDGKFQHTRTLSTGNNSGPYLVIVNDFNQDNYLDIAVGNGHGKYVSTYLGDGRGNFSELATYYSKSSPLVLITVDINKDGILDFITANRYEHDASVLLGNGNGTFEWTNTFSTRSKSLPYAIAVSDFTGDGKLDLIIANSGRDHVGIYIGHGDGTFREEMMIPVGIGSEPIDIAVGDFNRDHRNDFIVANRKHDSIGIFLQTCT